MVTFDRVCSIFAVGRKIGGISIYRIAKPLLSVAESGTVMGVILMVKTCTFFGHRQVSESVLPKLHEILVKLIEERKVTQFYVGNQGGFDRMVRKELKELKKLYPKIDYSVVLAYLPIERDQALSEDYSDTVYPAGLEQVPPKFAIDKRNRLLVDWSDIVVTCVQNSVGGAAKFKNLSIQKGKEVIEINS